MHDGPRLVFCQKSAHFGGVAHIFLVEMHPRQHQHIAQAAQMACVTEFVDDDDVVITHFGQIAHHMRADETRASCHHYAFCHTNSSP